MTSPASPLPSQTLIQDHELHPTLSNTKTHVSQFTYRQLQQLARSSPITPLRVIALVDYDAFYAQCEIVRLGLPETQPLAVQQWNDIIALNYAGRGFGFKRGASVDDVKRLCPNIVLQHVATWREGESTWAYRPDANTQSNMRRDKAALDPYRIESRKSIQLIKATLPPPPLQRIEKASIDEVFLDLSAHVHSILIERYQELSKIPENLDTTLPSPPLTSALDWKVDNIIAPKEIGGSDGFSDWDEVALNIGAEIVRGLRLVIHQTLGYTCSAGIAHNKFIAKLSAGCKKPNQQTVVRARAVTQFLSTYKITSIRGLAGKLGAKAVDAFGTEKLSDMLKVGEDSMVTELGPESGKWLFGILRGIDHSEVVSRTDIQSMLTQKTFAPPLEGIDKASSWLRIFAADLFGRIVDLEVETGRPRRPTILSLHHHIRGRFGPTRSKQATIPSSTHFSEALLLSISMDLLQEISADSQPTWPCLSLGLSVHNFEHLITHNERITSFFTPKSTAVASNKRKRSSSPKIDGKAEPFHMDPPDTRARNAEVSDYTCPKCHKGIDASAVLEHLDWHVAVELQEDGD